MLLRLDIFIMYMSFKICFINDMSGKRIWSIKILCYDFSQIQTIIIMNGPLAMLGQQV